MSGNTPRRSASRRSSAPLQILVLAALALAPPAGVDAQHHAPDAPATVSDTLALHGVVLDSASGEPLPASTVRLLEVDRQDYTHDDGTFHLYRVPEGRYTLIVEHLGYRTADVDVRLPRAVPGQLVVRLQSSALDLPGLLVTATMGARSRSEAHQLSQVLGGRDLQRELEATVAETLAGGAGMASTSMGPAPARPVIRGLSGDRILVLEDGERVGDVSSASPDHAVSVEAASAKRIEVVRGPSALFYGSNALGGVINVVRDEIPTALPDHPTGAVTVQGQSVNRGGAASGAFAQRIGPVAFRFEGSGRWADDTRTPDGPLGNTGIDTYSGAGGAAWIREGGHVGASLRIYRSDYGIPPDPVAGHADGVTVEMERDAVRGEAVVGDLAGLGRLTASAAYTRYDHREIESDGGVGTAFGQNTGAGELVLRHGGLGPFTSGGLGVRGQWQEYTSDNGRDRVRADESSGAIYGLQELESGRLSLQIGARYDVHSVRPQEADDIFGVPARDRVFHNVSGSISGLLGLTEDWRLGAAVSRAFRAPSADELFSQGPHLAAYTWEVGNPDLEPETGLGVDLFVRVEADRISAEGGVFWNEIADYSYPVNTGDRRGSLYVYRFVNTDARFLGAELSGRWLVSGPLVVDGDVSWVRATNLAFDEPLPLIPPLHGSATVRWDRDRWYVEAGWEGAARQDRVPDRPDLPEGLTYCDEPGAGTDCRPVPGDVLPTDGYGIVNAGAGYRWFPGHQTHAITLSVRNLTDELYRNHLSRIKELSPEPGLGVTLTYRASF